MNCDFVTHSIILHIFVKNRHNFGLLQTVRLEDSVGRRARAGQNSRDRGRAIVAPTSDSCASCRKDFSGGWEEQKMADGQWLVAGLDESITVLLMARLQH